MAIMSIKYPNSRDFENRRDTFSRSSSYRENITLSHLTLFIRRCSLSKIAHKKALIARMTYVCQGSLDDEHL